jgi:hypothetical protein
MEKLELFKLGKDIALGKKGTGWMAIGKSDIQEALKTEGKTPEEKFYNWAEGWKETLQWEHEVGKKLKPMTEETIGERIEQEDLYFHGYTEGMKEKYNKLKKLKEVV